MSEVVDAEGEDTRRLDWRFLLPHPELGSVLLDGTVDDALRLELERAASELAGPEGPSAGHDLAVLVAPTADQVRRAVARVRPGGSLYLELAAPHRRVVPGPSGRRIGPRAASRLLVAGGASDPIARWHWPSHREALELVPLGDRAAMAVSLARRRGRFGRLAAAAVRRVATAGWLAAVLPAVSLVAHRPETPSGDSAGGGSFPADLAAAAVLALEHGGPGGPLDGVRSVVLTPRHHASRHVVFLVLDGSGSPRWVAKAPRRPGDRAALDREAAILGRLATQPAMAAIAPRLVAAPAATGWPLLLESMVVGRTLHRAAIHADADGWAARATELVEVLARAPDGAATVGRESSDRFERLVAGPLTDLRSSATADGDPLGLAALVDRTLARLSARTWAELPSVVEHGDLAPPNLVVTDPGALAAIDWELAEPDGLAGHDLALFLGFAATARASATAMRDVEAAAAVVATAFERPDAWAARRLRAHLAWLGVDAAWASDVALAAFARVAASMPTRTGRPPGPWLARDRHLACWRLLVERSA